MTTLLSANNYYYRRGGAETVFLEHNAIFEAQGWRVVPFSMQHVRNLATPWSRHFVQEIELGNDYSLAAKLVRVPKVVYSLEARRKLARLLGEVRVDICHAHNLYHHISPSILGLLRARGIPTVMTLHDLKLACPAYNMLTHDGICDRCRGGRLHNVLLHRCIKGSLALSGVVFAEALLHRLLQTYERCVDRFVVPSRFYVAKLAEWGLPRERFVQIPNFIDVRAYRADPAPGKRYVYVGRLSPEKGVATLVRAAGLAGCGVTVIGTGPQADSLRHLALQCGADVEFTGFLSGDALQVAIRSARAVVLPSEWYENAPMSVLEGYALGKPCVGARIGGLPELIREDETGATFEAGNVADLAAVLRRFGDLPDAAVRDMGVRGRAWIESDFSADVYRDRMLAVYREFGVR